MGHPPILLGTISMVDSVILMVMALVVFGPRRLPQIGRQIGKLMYEFRKASNDFKFQMEEELRNAEEADRRKKEEATQRSLAVEQASVSADPTATTPTVQTAPSPDNYPEQYPPETSQSTEAVESESAPRIQPPSVGETIARPARATSQPVTGAADAATPGLNDLPSAGASSQNPPKPTETAEAMNQHG
jgi:sec-independent protein translocase protein TatB